MRRLSSALIALAGIINVIPISGVASGARLEALYGVPLQDPNLLIMMRHRAVVIAIVGGLLLVSVFVTRLRGVAAVAGLTSMLSYLVLVTLVGGYNADLGRVALADVVAAVGLLGAIAIDRRSARPERG